MVTEERLPELLNELNEALGDVTPYKLAVANPKDLKPLEKNAHFMPKRVYDQLVANIRRDRNLSTLPFCWRRADGSYVVLSGNHRVKGAVDAGIPKILFLFTDEALTRSEQIAIQLSHNALVGEDNPAVLVELWREMDEMAMKVYSGLDDNLLQTLMPVKTTKLADEPLRFEELVIQFLPAEADRLEEILKRLAPVSRRRFAASVDEFDRFFEALLNFKEATGVYNTATAFIAIAEILEDYLKSLEENRIIERNTSEQTGVKP